MSQDLQDEDTSIKAIYGDKHVLEKLPTEELLYTITFPSQPSVSLRIEFPQDYPNAPPSILGTQTVGDSFAKGEGAYLVELVRDVLSKVYTPGAPCIFDLIEEVDSRLQELGMSELEPPGDDLRTESKAKEEESTLKTKEDSPTHLSEPPPWTLSEVVTEKKSIFLARCAPITTLSQATTYINHLLSTDKKAAKATHNISAWRLLGENGVQYHDCDDDGELAAGRGLLQLLEFVKAWNVVVVVSRWYGGVQLGPDRFRIINQTAREALVKGGFEGGRSGGKKGKK